MNDFDIPLNNELGLTANPQELVPSSLLEAKELVTDDSLSTSNSLMLPTTDSDILRYEMEELKLSNYLIESNDVSSGGKHISLLGSDGNSGTAAGVFNGEAGTYQVNVGFYDEDDGVSGAKVTVAGDTKNFSFDKDLPAGGVAAKTLTSHVTHSEIELKPGDAFEIKGKANYGEYARFDYVEFVPTDSLTDTNIDTGKEVKSPTPNSADTDADKFYVSQKGSDDNPGTKDLPWKTIDYAVSKDSAVEAGDTILVQPGTYKELITLEKSGNEKLGHITLKADGDVTLRDPDPIKGGFREGVIQSANRGHWIIDGFRIENTSWAGISLRDANNMIVQNNHTFETGASGIIVLPESYYGGGEAEVTSKDIKILDNKIERANWRWTGRGDENGTQEALSIWGVDGFEVANNIVKQATREGIDIKTGSRNGSVHNNTVTGAAKISLIT